MKSVIQKFLATVLGIKIIRAKSAKKYLPKPCVDNVEIIVRFYTMMSRPIELLQIGACDGVTSDSIFSYIKSGKINAFLVEPSSVNYGKLKEFYKEEKNATLINVAIADRDEKRPFYTVKDEGRWADVGWARQLASFYKSHLLKHDIKEEEIAVEEVECSTLSTILKKYNIKDLDILLIDTEGYDGEIVKMALKQNVLPNFIVFENAQLVQMYSQKELDELYTMIYGKGYVWTHDRINTMAVKKDFFLAD
jgi:FkbM family methyltransferase